MQIQKRGFSVTLTIAFHTSWKFTFLRAFNYSPATSPALMYVLEWKKKLKVDFSHSTYVYVLHFTFRFSFCNCCSFLFTLFEWKRLRYERAHERCDGKSFIKFPPIKLSQWAGKFFQCKKALSLCCKWGKKSIKKQFECEILDFAANSHINEDINLLCRVCQLAEIKILIKNYNHIVN